MAVRPEDVTLDNMDKSSVEELKEYRDITKEAQSDLIKRLADITRNEQHINQDLMREINELQIVIEPSLAKVNDLDKQIQAEIKLHLKTELIDELKVRWAFAAKIKVMLNNLSELCQLHSEVENLEIVGRQTTSLNKRMPVLETSASPELLFPEFLSAEKHINVPQKANVSVPQELRVSVPQGVNSGMHSGGQDHTEQVVCMYGQPILESNLFNDHLRYNVQPQPVSP